MLATIGYTNCDKFPYLLSSMAKILPPFPHCFDFLYLFIIHLTQIQPDRIPDLRTNIKKESYIHTLCLGPVLAGSLPFVHLRNINYFFCSCCMPYGPLLPLVSVKALPSAFLAAIRLNLKRATASEHNHKQRHFVTAPLATFEFFNFGSFLLFCECDRSMTHFSSRYSSTDLCYARTHAFINISYFLWKFHFRFRFFSTFLSLFWSFAAPNRSFHYLRAYFDSDSGRYFFVSDPHRKHVQNQTAFTNVTKINANPPFTVSTINLPVANTASPRGYPCHRVTSDKS